MTFKLIVTAETTSRALRALRVFSLLGLLGVLANGSAHGSTCSGTGGEAIARPSTVFALPEVDDGLPMADPVHICVAQEHGLAATLQRAMPVLHATQGIAEPLPINRILSAIDASALKEFTSRPH